MDVDKRVVEDDRLKVGPLVSAAKKERGEKRKEKTGFRRNIFHHLTRYSLGYGQIIYS